jgi:hypothetical protein
MIYLIAMLMGYVAGTNSLVAKQARIPGRGFFNPKVRFLLTVGGFSGWFCILPAALAAGAYSNNTFLGFILFVVAAVGGAFAAGLFQIPIFNRLIGILSIFLNIGLTILVFSIF